MPLDLDAELSRFRAAHQPRCATFAGAPWSYIVGGEGPDTLLLLPGAPGIAEMAFLYIAAFEQRYRVIAPSYPAAVGSLDQLLAGLTDLLDAETDGPIHLIGASYSGMVAQYVLRRHPEQIISLLIGDTGVPRRDRALAMGLAIAVISRLPRLGLHATLAAALAYVLSGSTPAHRFWQRYFKGVVTMLTVPEFANRVRVMIDMDQQGHQILPATPWRGPTLLMETVDDPLFSAAERAALRERYPQAEVHTFYTKGHITALTRAPDYIAVMQGFLARHGQAEPAR
ncbi:MAG: alpha/beta hydrolase [Chloroflexales bacterium]|nr:alpha/beta hydrolase [Chloroflexales bacterium]